MKKQKEQLTQKPEIEDFRPAFANTVLCADFISKEFEECITEIFNKLGETISKKGAVLSVTRAYYVFIDLKNNIPLSKIEEYRLQHFHTFLWGYLLNNAKDKKSNKLWEIIDHRLGEICT